jgi:hypothetical protein
VFVQKLLQVHHAAVPSAEESGEVQRGRRPGDHHLRRHPHAPDARLPPPLRRGVLRGPAPGHGGRPLPEPPGPQLHPPPPPSGLRPGFPPTSHGPSQHPRPAAQSEPQSELASGKLQPAAAEAAGVPARESLPSPAVFGIT